MLQIGKRGREKLMFRLIERPYDQVLINFIVNYDLYGLIISAPVKYTY